MGLDPNEVNFWPGGAVYVTDNLAAELPASASSPMGAAWHRRRRGLREGLRGRDEQGVRLGRFHS